MYILTELGKSFINCLAINETHNFQKIMKEFEGGAKQFVIENKIIQKFDIIRMTRNTYQNNARTYILAPEYFLWENQV